MIIRNDAGEYMIDTPEGWKPTQLIQNSQTGERAYKDPTSGEWKPYKPETVGDVVKGAGRSALGGATFNYGEELEAGTRSLLGDKPYGDVRKEIEREQSAFREAHPAIDFGASMVGGGLTGGYGAAKALGSQAVRQAPRLARYAAYPLVGAVEGGLAGSGENEQDRMAGARSGATTGAAVGTVLPVAGAVAKKTIIDPIATRLSESARARTAGEYVNKALARDRMTPDSAMDEMLRRQGALVDVGRNTEALGMHAAQSPGPALSTATDFVTNRRAGQVDRIRKILDSAVTPAGKQVMQKVEESPAFLKTLEKTVDLTPEIRQYLARPSLRKAWSNAQRLAAEKDIVVPDPDVILSGPYKGVKTEWLHYLKKGLDDVLEPKRDVTGKIVSDYGRNELEAMKKTRALFRDQAKTLNPEYGKALDDIAREKRLDAAFEKGQDLMRSIKYGPPVVRRIMRGMSDEEKRNFQRGVVDGILTRIAPKAETGDDVSKIVALQIPRMRAIFGDKADDVATAIKNEIAKMRTENRIEKGPLTAFRLSVAQDMDRGMAGTVADVAEAGMTGGSPGVVRQAWGGLKSMTSKPPEAVMDDVARLVMNEDPQEVRRLLDRAIAARNQRLARTGRGISYGLLGAANVGAGGL